MRYLLPSVLGLSLATSALAGSPPDEFVGRDFDIFDEIRPAAATNDRFGWSAAVVRGYAFVGALMRDPSVNTGGLALYRLPQVAGASWTFERFVDPPPPLGKSVYGRDVAADGEWLAVNNSIECPDPGNSSDGVVHLFRRDLGGAGNWGLHATLCRTETPGIEGGAMGDDLDLQGDLLIVGSDIADVDGESDSGAAYIFERHSGGVDNWGQVAALRRQTPAAQDRFGQSVGIFGDTAVVGAPGAILSMENDVGVALIFQRNQGGANNWGFVKELRGGAVPAAGDDFGRSADVWDSVVVVGSRAVATDGAAHIYYRDLGGANNWGELTQVTPDAFVNTNFSHDLELRGHELMVGSLDNKVWVFQQDAGGDDQWSRVQLIEDLDPEAEAFGRAVSFFNGYAIVGDSGHDNTPDTVNGVGASTLLFDDVIFRNDFQTSPSE